MEFQTLQTIFYSLGIVFMSLMLILMVLAVLYIFYIKKRVGEIQKDINEKLELLANRPIRFATEMGREVAEKIKKISESK